MDGERIRQTADDAEAIREAMEEQALRERFPRGKVTEQERARLRRAGREQRRARRTQRRR